MAEINNSEIKLISSDNKEFMIDIKIVNSCMVIKNMLEDIESEDKDLINIPNITGDILELLIQYLKYHFENPILIPESEKEEKSLENIIPWDREFFSKFNMTTLLNVISAANYLEIKPLLNLACKIVAIMIKGKTAEEVRTMFSIENDFTPEEEEQVRKENEWNEEK